MKAKLLLLLLPGWTFAAAEKTRPIAEATIQLISLAGDLPDLALWDGRKATPLLVSADFFGPRLHYRGEPRLRLIRNATPTDQPAPPVAEPDAQNALIAPGPTVAWLDLPLNSGPLKLILLVQPEPGRNGILAMPDDDRQFPVGSLRFMNLCDYPVSLETGSRVTAFPAKGSGIIRPNVASGRYFDGNLYSEEDHERRLAYHLHFFYASDRRTLLFILPGEKGSGLVRLQPIEEPPGAGTGGSTHDAAIKPPKTIK